MVFFLFLEKSFWRVLSQIGTERGGPCSESRVGPTTESDSALCEWEKIRAWAKVVYIEGWFVCETVRYRVSTVHTPGIPILLGMLYSDISRQ